MNNREKILNLLESCPSEEFTNGEIRSRTGVKPHQQVFQITKFLMDQGLIKGTQRGKEWFFCCPKQSLSFQSGDKKKNTQSENTRFTDQNNFTGKRVVLVSCVKMKLNKKSRAEDLYISPLFQKMMAYAKRLHPEKIFILSAKYGLLSLNETIEPYEQTLKSMNAHEKSQWAENVISKLRESCDLNNSEFIFLAGLPYRENLTPHLRHYSVPMEGLSFGKQLQWLEEQPT